MLEPDPAQRRDQDIGYGGEPEPDLVGAHGMGRGTVGKHIELTFLDAVFHLAAGAVGFLVEMPCLGFLRLERGDDKAGIGLALCPFRLADDTALPAPAFQRAPG